MSWWPLSSSSPEEKRASEVRTGAVAPLRTERQRCYASRDAYFGCLDAHDITDALAEPKKAAKACKDETAGFERDCAAQWVQYFKEWRVQNLKKEAKLKELEARGAQKLETHTEFK